MEDRLKADREAYRADQTRQPALQTRAQNMAKAYDALSQLQSATGKGAAGLSGLRSWAASMGIATDPMLKEQKLIDEVVKYTTKAMVDAGGGATTDLGRHLSEQSNPGLSITSAANFDILRNDMGKTLQEIATYKAHDGKAGGAGYMDHRANIADITDPRGFVWSMYSPAEQKKILAEVGDENTVAHKKLSKAMGMTQRLQLQIPGLTGAPPPQRQSALAMPALNPPMALAGRVPPISAPPNALLMAGRSPNALAPDAMAG